jgi:hypothetical protein
MGMELPVYIPRNTTHPSRWLEWFDSSLCTPYWITWPRHAPSVWFEVSR